MKYMGSKARFAKDILPIILKNRTNDQYYVEPFAGGMNLICCVSGNRIANDISAPLIEMWIKLVDGWKPREISKERYIEIKKRKEKFPQHLVGWVGFNCSYSGKFFGGFAGETITEDFNIRDYQKEAIKNTMAQVASMVGVEFKNVNYFDLDIPKNSIVYCDPPYFGTTKYSQNFDHDYFWDWVKLISKKNSVYISEYSAPKEFECIWEKETRSSLSANGSCGGSKKSVEKLFRLTRKE